MQDHSTYSVLSVFSVALFVALVLCLATSGDAWAAADYTIDNTGGDCSLIGHWDVSTKTCTLYQDIDVTTANDGIEIVGSDISLDGTSHYLNGPGISSGNGVYVHNSTNVKVYGLTVRKFSNGISLLTNPGGNIEIFGNEIYNNSDSGIALEQTQNTDVRDNTVRNNTNGIRVKNSDHNTVKNNNVKSNPSAGILIFDSSAYINVEGNTIEENGNQGIYLADSNNCKVTGNMVTKNNEGIRIDNSTALLIYKNEFLENSKNAVVIVSGSPVINFNMPLPDGGNHWSDYDTPAEGCHDENSDGFCDAGYVISVADSIADSLPVVAKGDQGAADDQYGADGGNGGGNGTTNGTTSTVASTTQPTAVKTTTQPSSTTSLTSANQPATTSKVLPSTGMALVIPLTGLLIAAAGALVIRRHSQ